MKTLFLFAGLFLLGISAWAQPTFNELQAISNGCGDLNCFSKFAGEKKFLFEKQAFAKGISIPSYIYKGADAVNIGNTQVYSYLVYSSVKNPGLLSISLGYRTPDLKVISRILDNMKADGFTTASTAIPLIYTKNDYKEKIHFFSETRSIDGTTYQDYNILFIVTLELRDESTQFYGDIYVGENLFTGFCNKDDRTLGILKYKNGNVFKGGGGYGVMEYTDNKRFYGKLGDASPKEAYHKKTEWRYVLLQHSVTGGYSITGYLLGQVG
ncbi:MAG: hypothetical protein V9F01_02505 [Chitinophagaceae bacterium]